MNLEPNSDQVSYLIARDPSIISYSRTNFKRVRCDLIPLMNETRVLRNGGDGVPRSEVDTYMKIFLRLKGDVEVSPLYNVEENVFSCEVPQSQLPKHLKDGDVLYKNYSFSRIFENNATQTELFDTIVKPKIFDLINGRNSTLLAYGASGSGKTYTIVGTELNPGIIPRALEYLFRSLPTLDNAPKIQATEGDRIKNLSLAEQLHAQEVKGSLTSFFDKLSQAQIHKDTYRKMQQRLSDQPAATVDLDGVDVAVAVWISFVEIYNETIYDLLKPHTKNRRKLVLGVRKNAAPHIKGLSSVFVSTGLEAYQILKYGLTNLNYAATALNDHSSRSHCVFTLKLVQSCGGGSEGCVSTFNFCDLAGSERLKKTHNVGDRLKESNNINTSLFVLGRCLKEVRESQKRKDSRTIPFRDSKLTQLFQYAISGQENLSMIVNVNPSEYMYPETQHVLNFSAIAMEVKIEQKPKVAKLNATAEDDETVNQRILELENLLDHMQQHINNLEDERLDKMSKYMEVIRRQSEDLHARWRQRLDEQTRRHKAELQSLQLQECEYCAKNDSVVVISDDDDDDLYSKCRDEISILKRALKDKEEELALANKNVYCEKRESLKLLARVIELENDVDINNTYNDSVQLLESDGSDGSDNDYSSQEELLEDSNAEHVDD